jgi:hypothetical protein
MDQLSNCPIVPQKEIKYVVYGDLHLPMDFNNLTECYDFITRHRIEEFTIEKHDITITTVVHRNDKVSNGT